MSAKATKFVEAYDPDSVRRSRPLSRASEVPWLLHVLIVDDDPADSWLIGQALHHDTRVRLATSTDTPVDELAQLRNGDIQPHLILVDIKMPKIDGFEFVDAIRDIPALANTPVAMLTTSRNATDVMMARDKNVCSYVVKPDSFEMLRKRLAVVVTQAMKEWRPL